MKIRKSLLAAALSLAAFGSGQAQAADVYAYVQQTIPAQSDVLVTVPVNNQAEVESAVSGTVGSALTVPNSPSFAAGDYNVAGSFARYYVRVIGGAGAGLWSSINSNTETSITLADAAVAAQINGTSTIRVYRHHTIGSVFPTALVNISVVTGTQILFYSNADARNKAPGSGGTVSFINPVVGWGPNASRPLNPEEAFVIRNNSNAPLTYIKTGLAPDHAVSYLIKGGVVRDTALGTGYPATVTVKDTGLGRVTGDQILRQSNTGKNDAPGNAGTFSFINPVVGWGPNAGVGLAPNSAFIFRQPVGDPGGVVTVTKPY